MSVSVALCLVYLWFLFGLWAVSLTSCPVAMHLCYLMSMWPESFLALWLCCLVALWPYGFLPCCLVRLWVCCLVALWPCGLVAFVALWPCGLVALLPCGFVALNLCCLVAVLPGAFAALWLCGFVALWPCGLDALWPRSLVAFWPCGFVSGPGFGIVTLCLAFACRLVALLPGPECFGASIETEIRVFLENGAGCCQE